jgi:hypothetical protein
VQFEDPKLEQTVRLWLGLGPGEELTGELMSTLVEFQLFEGEGNNLVGLECAINLDSLTLGNPEIETLAPIATLSKLTNLSIEGLALDQPGDLDPVSNLPALTSLSIYGAQDPDLTALTGPDANPNLVALTLESSQLSSLGLLTELEALQILRLHGNQLYEIQGIEDMTELWWLDLSWNPVESLEPLTDHPSLIILDISASSASDLGPLATVATLQHLEANFLTPYGLVLPMGLSASAVGMRGNGVSGISPAMTWAAPLEWDLRENEIVDLTPLLDFPWPADQQCFELNVGDNPLDPETSPQVISSLCASAWVVIETGNPNTSCHHPECVLEP